MEPILFILLALVGVLAIALIVTLNKLHEARRDVPRTYPVDAPAHEDPAWRVHGSASPSDMEMLENRLPGQVVRSKTHTRVFTSTRKLKDIPPGKLEELMSGLTDMDLSSLVNSRGAMRMLLTSDRQSEVEAAMNRLVQAGINAAMDVHVEHGACTAMVSVAEQDLARAAKLLAIRQPMP